VLATIDKGVLDAELLVFRRLADMAVSFAGSP
jgi:hypothetical protein